MSQIKLDDGSVGRIVAVQVTHVPLLLIKWQEILKTRNLFVFEL